MTLSWTSAPFNGEVQKPTVTVRSASGGMMTLNSSYTLEYSAESVDPDTYTVTARGKGYYTGSVTKEYTILSLVDLTDENVVISGTCFQYDGTAKSPEITVTANGAALVKDTDYTVSYSGDCIENGPYTVTVAGLGRYTGEVSADFTISETGHTPQALAAVEATCTEPGLTAGSKCAVCGTVLVAQEDVPALGHDMIRTEAVAATCLAPGNHEYYTCNRCHNVYGDEEGAWGTTTVAEETLPQLEHSYTGDIKDNNDGTHSFQCVNGCGEYSEPVACSKFKYRHYFAGCVTDEYTEKICADCGQVLETTPGAGTATGHIEAVEVDASCTEAAYSIITECTHHYIVETKDADGNLITSECEDNVCGYMEKTYSTDPDKQKLGHDVDENTIWTPDPEHPATCVVGGIETTVCPRCHETITRETDPLGHDISGVSPSIVNPTCTASGSKTYKCKRCDLSEVIELAPTHDFTGRNTKMSTVTKSCTVDGYTVYECKNKCLVPTAELKEGDIVKMKAASLTVDDTVIATGGTIKALYALIDKIEEVNGDRIYTLDFTPAGHPGTTGVFSAESFTSPVTKREVDPSPGHTAEIDRERSTTRTCTQDGELVFSGYCSVCEQTVDNLPSVILKATGHSPVSNQSPTCTESIACSNAWCATGIATPALGHDYKIPSCAISDNVNGFYCSRCGQLPDANADKLSTLVNILNTMKGHAYASNKLDYFSKTHMNTSYTKFDFGIYTSLVKPVYEENVDGETISYDSDMNTSIFMSFPLYYRNLAVKDNLTMGDLDSIKIEQLSGLNMADLLGTFNQKVKEDTVTPDMTKYTNKTINEKVIKVTVDMKDEYFAKEGSNISTNLTEDSHVSKIFNYDVREIITESGYDPESWSITEPISDDMYLKMDLNYATDSTKLVYYFTADKYEPICMICTINEDIDQNLTMKILSVTGEIKPLIQTTRTYAYLFSNYFNTAA